MSEKSRLIGLVLLVILYHGGPARACSPAAFVVAIDVGHSLRSPGAVSARGVPEFRFNRDLAAAAADVLAAGGFRRSFVINADGTAQSLRGRTDEAARRGADLLLSIHHDSVQPRYLSNWTLDGVTRPYSDHFRGFSLFVSAKNRQAERSRRFAELLGRSLTARGLTPTLHHAEPIAGEHRPLLDARLGLYRFDDLVVLKGAAMPAVLLEAGVILNRDEESLLAQGAYQQRIAAAILAAVQDYCDALPPG
ncbi:N-acetylmuramoyl-L-alanine amidase family protein [Candidatus Thiodictyon syntrophicum]|jgi:N-acetylmuramoyl-L-alanine amidase|uniref:N-acetylmuramoyl-L-alanine amidase n=1 Tax=Candidatus Thiodictyon syntrophicum TaxID=1166950 RepID=A0A2K8UGJ5_9GAMM|nr:N-acetylmuramoyl-L-alanine amidase [Candidatus Thiodictyon syntrophicum]AUB84241.1 hypothetical protein THSYN_27095 [Candidatus Thiodictyon syntrophicum]